MKTKFTIFLALLFLFFVQICSSQEIPEDIVKRVNTSDYIFEGRVIRSDSYWSRAHNRIFTSNTIEIYKILKGELECGTIELLTLGGEKDNWKMDVSKEGRLYTKFIKE